MRNLLMFFLLFGAMLIAQEKVIILDNGDIFHGLVKEDGDNYRIKVGEYGVITVPKKNVKRIVEPKETPPAPPVQLARIPTGKKMQNEDILVRNLLRYVPSSLDRAHVSGVRHVAIKRVAISGAYDVNDKVFETKFIDMLVKRGGYNLIERQALDILLKEQQLSLSGLTADAEAKTGKLIGVDAFITIEIFAASDQELRAAVKMTGVESSSVLWEDEFTGINTGDFKLSLGAGYGFPIHISHSFFSYTSAVATINYDTGHLAELSLRAGMVIPMFRLIEWNIVLAAGGDNFNPNPQRVSVTVSNASGNTNRFTADSVSTFQIQPIVLKFHLSELWNSPDDVFRPYLGFGAVSYSFGYRSPNFMNGEPLMGGGLGLNGIAGLEIAPIREFSFFAEGGYSLSSGKIKTGDYAPENAVVTPLYVRFGVMYYFFK